MAAAGRMQLSVQAAECLLSGARGSHGLDEPIDAA